MIVAEYSTRGNIMRTIRILFLVSYVVQGMCIMMLMSVSTVSTLMVMIAFIGWMLGVIALILKEFM